jgi:hypothetical protein
MGEAFPGGKRRPAHQSTQPLYLSKEIPAVIATDRSGGLHVVTQYDLIQAI